LSSNFSIAETDSFKKKLSNKDFSHLKTKLYNYVYPLLKNNPFYGGNIKKLKGEFSDIYRYRIGNFRIFYTIKEAELIVILVDIQKRKDAYK
jgi:mRNA interferase RelE/StbE